MARTVVVSPSQLLEAYGKGEGFNWLNVKVGTEQRVYYRTRSYPCLPSEEYVVVYCVI